MKEMEEVPIADGEDVVEDSQEWVPKVMPGTGNLKGVDVKGLVASELEELQKLILEFEDIFGELPPADEAIKLVVMELRLKPEHKGQPLRCRPYPMQHEDQKQLQEQLAEMIQHGMVEEYQGTEYPTFCSPVFMIRKKGTTTKRMTINYSKVNQRLEQNVASLPLMEQTLEIWQGLDGSRRWT
jgi:hypothetical protein